MSVTIATFSLFATRSPRKRKVTESVQTPGATQQGKPVGVGLGVERGFSAVRPQIMYAVATLVPVKDDLLQPDVEQVKPATANLTCTKEGAGRVLHPSQPGQ